MKRTELDGRKVETLVVDWHFSEENGEEYLKIEPGLNGVKEIRYYPPAVEGDRHHADVEFNDGSVCREFNINSVSFGPRTDKFQKRMHREQEFYVGS